LTAFPVRFGAARTDGKVIEEYIIAGMGHGTPISAECRSDEGLGKKAGICWKSAFLDPPHHLDF
jgi:hypothetical protein